MDVVLFYNTKRKWFWIQKKTINEIQPGDSPEDGRTYSYDMLWDGRSEDFKNKQSMSRRSLSPPSEIKKIEFEANDDEDDVLPIAIIAIFEYGEELGL